MKTKKLIFCVSISAAVAQIMACAAPAKAPEIGSAMADFKLTDLSGKQHSLSQYKGSIVVLDFMSPQCPFSVGVDQSLPELAKNYSAKGVVFLGISSNAPVTKEELQSYSSKAKLPYPVLLDTGNGYADAVGATRTPEFYILDKDQKLAYHGAYDDRKVPEKAGDANYIQKALDELTAGQPVTTAKVNAWGCTIKRK